MATAAGAQLLGLGNEIGEIRAGAQADLVLMRRRSVFLVPANNLLNLLVYSENGADVTDVFVDGHQILVGGRLTGLDESRLLEAAEEAASRGRSRTADQWALAERLDPFVRTACYRLLSDPLPVDRFAAKSTPSGGAAMRNA
jgi:hypothetical protein